MNLKKNLVLPILLIVLIVGCWVLFRGPAAPSERSPAVVTPETADLNQEVATAANFVDFEEKVGEAEPVNPRITELHRLGNTVSEKEAIQYYAQWLEEDLFTALALLADWPEEWGLRPFLKVAVKAYYAQLGPEETQSWIATLEDSAHWRVVPYTTLATEWSSDDPVGAAAWVDSNAFTGHMADAYPAVARNWAEADFDGAFSWAQSLSNGTLSQSVTAEVVEAYAAVEPEAVGDFLNTLDNSEGVYDTALYAYSQASAKASPEDAMEWASSITDGELKVSAMWQVGSVWRIEQPDSWDSWIGAFEEADPRLASVLRQKAFFDL